MRPLFALLCCTLALLGCRSSVTATDSDAERLARWLTGRFASAGQAPDDLDGLHLVLVPIWPERADGPWLYLEQAAANALERPHHQRIHHLVATPEGVRSDIYELPGDPLGMAGAWQNPESFAPLDPRDLLLREGCSIHFSDHNGTFVGSTIDSGCGSPLGEATYATSEVTVTPDTLTSWDRGFDSSGDQAWGATEGPYVFVRVE